MRQCKVRGDLKPIKDSTENFSSSSSELCCDATLRPQQRLCCWCGHTEELNSSPQQLTTSLTAVPAKLPLPGYLEPRPLIGQSQGHAALWLADIWSCLGFGSLSPGLVTCLQLRSWTLTLPRGLDSGHNGLVSCIRTPIVRAAQCCCCCGGAVAYSLNPSPIHIGPQQFSNTLVMMILKPIVFQYFMTMMLCASCRIFKYVSLNMRNVWCSPRPVSAFLKVLMTQTESPGLSETCHGGVSNGPVTILVKDRFWSIVAKPKMSSPRTFWLTFSPCVLPLAVWGFWFVKTSHGFPLLSQWTIFSDMRCWEWACSRN